MVYLSEVLSGNPPPLAPSVRPGVNDLMISSIDYDEDSLASEGAGMLTDLSDQEAENDDGAEAIDRLDSFVESLTAKKKESEEPVRKRRITERTEAYEESEYNLPPVSSRDESSARSKLELGDLLTAVADETAYTGLKKRMEALETKAQAKVLDAPLPKRLQDKLNRAAAYEEAKEEISKWQEIVKRNREADHLSFPMNRPPPETSSIAKLAQLKPTSAMERQINDVLVRSGIQEKNIQRFEELELNKLSVNEVEARRNELRFMRELMFREEIKTRRVAKIKSKTYRRLNKKEREKNALSVEQLNDLDPEAACTRQMKAEKERAKERMTLKHRNSAKNMLKQAHHDSETRQAISEALSRHEALKRKIEGTESGDEDRSSDEDEPFSGDERAIRDHALRKLDAFEQMLEAEEAPTVGKSLFQMKFMREAAERKKKEALAQARELREELEMAAGASGEEFAVEEKDEGEEKNGTVSVIKVGNNPGRMVFSCNKAQVLLAQACAPHTDRARDLKETSITTSSSGVFSVEDPAPSSALPLPRTAENPDEEYNPWLEAISTKKQAKRKKRGAIESTMEEKLQNKVKKIKAANKAQAETVDIDVDSLITVKGKEVVAVQQPSPEPASLTLPSENGCDHVSDEDGVVDNAGAAPLMHSKSQVAFTQRELVQLAFAGDDVVEEFEKEKRANEKADEEEEAKKDGNGDLPGWGAWGGIGIKLRKPLSTKKDSAPKKTPNRRDAKLKHVIINEKKIKKAVKYTVTELPYPFTSRGQYERSLRVPLGREWNTAGAHSKMIKPRIITKQGAVIDPLTAPF